MEQEAEVVPGRGVRRVDRDDAAVGVDGVLPLRGVGVPFARALEPRLRLLGRGLERPHEPRHQRRGCGLGERAGVQGEHRLAGPRIEANAIRLNEQAPPFHEEAHLGQRVLQGGILPAQGAEGLADLTDRGAGVEERARRAGGEQIAERVSRGILQEIEPTQLPQPSRR